MSDLLLGLWLVVDLVWTVLVFGATAYLVFWQGRSGWWFLFAIVLAFSMGGGKLCTILAKRLGGQ